MFLQSVSDVGYKVTEKVKKEIEEINKNKVLSDFLDDLSAYLKHDNVVTNAQHDIYGELKSSDQTLSSKDLLEAVRSEEHKRNSYMQRQRSLQRELTSTKTRIALLQQQLHCLEGTHEDAMAHAQQIQEVEKSTLTDLERMKDNYYNASKEYSCDVNEIQNVCEAASSRYENNRCHTLALLSHVDLDEYLDSEDSYTAQLTQYAKSQFRDVPSITNDITGLSGKLYSAADTILLGDADEQVKRELLDDMRRATQGYANRKKRAILAKAELERAIAVKDFLQRQRIDFSYKSSEMSESRLTQTFKYSGDTTTDQSSYIMKSVLPALLSKGAMELKNLVLNGDFKRKLSKQRQIRTKQRKMIDLLLEQCSRFSLVWMLLNLERTHGVVLSKKMTALDQILADTTDVACGSVRTFNSVARPDNSTKEPKAVIDKRDSVLLGLYDILAASSSGSMFKTYESLHDSASNLTSNRDPAIARINVNLSLHDAVRILYWNFSNVEVGDGQLLLSDPEITERLEKLQNAVAAAKVSVTKLLTTVDKQRAFMKHNEDADRARLAWIDFVLTALEQKGK